MTETTTSLLELLGLTESNNTLNNLVASGSKYIKDLKINTSNALQYETLTPKESLLIALATVLNEKNTTLIETFSNQLTEKHGLSAEEHGELIGIVSLMNVNNIFYRFKHFAEKEYYNTAPAGIKMSVMMNPVLGKELFELISLCVSAINGCETCVKAHEQSVLQHGSNEKRIFEAIKLTAIIKGLSVVI